MTGSSRNLPASSRRRPASAPFVASLVALLAASLAGCSGQALDVYQKGVDTNYQNVGSIKLGMTREQVESLMGTGQIVGYKRIQLRNPWRTESYRVGGRTEVVILYYVTQGYVWQGVDDAHALTPVVFEDGSVVGWGWNFLQRNRDRYTLDNALKPK
ncbi:MAG TPA: DUF3192 domain-containing protein [Candidatus Binatia bacterium]|jgi:hypothetical protein